MNIADKILADLPIFRHFTSEEISSLKSAGAVSRVVKGSSVDLKKLNTFNVVINGLFEIEALGRTDIVYLAPGSFFGHIPFTGISLKGRVRAMLDTTMIIFKPDDIYRFFISNYSAMRGYISTITRMGLDISEAAAVYAARRPRVISVTSAVGRSRVSTASALISASLARRGRTVLIDMSCGERSIFDYFDRKLTPPFSHRRDSEQVNEDFISGRIVSVNEELDIMNFSYSSKVKVDAALVSPLMFVLSKRYDYIVFDLPSSDPELLREGLNASDYIVNVRKSRGDAYGESVPGALSGIKTVINLVNSFYEKNLRLSGGYILENVSAHEGGSLSGVTSPPLEEMTERIAKKKRALAVESNYLNSVFIAGFFSALYTADNIFDVIHSSSMSFLPAALYVVSPDSDAFSSAVISAYGESGYEKSLSIDFPLDHVFRAKSLQKYMRQLFGSDRIESYKTRLSALLHDEKALEQYIVSSGQIKDAAAASLTLGPLFEGVNVNGRMCSSGYPALRVRPEDLFRTDADEIYYLTVDNTLTLEPGPRVPPLLVKYIDGIESSRAADKFSDLSDANFCLEVSEKDMKIEKIIEITRDKSIKFLKDKKSL